MNRKKASFIRCHLLSCSRNLAVTSTSSIADPRWFTLEPAGIIFAAIRIDSQCERSMTQATRCADRRQKSRERGYYHLHRQLNNSLLLHNLPPFYCALSICFSP